MGHINYQSHAAQVNVSTLIEDTGSRIGIGTTTPETKLHVADGNLTLSNASAKPSMIFDNKSATTSADRGNYSKLPLRPRGYERREKPNEPH